MRILFVDHADALGGAEHSLLALLGSLDRRRFEPTVACPPGPLAERARELGVCVLEVRLERLRSHNPLASLSRLDRGARRLRGVLSEGGFEVVHANTLRAAAYAGRATRRGTARFLWHVRDFDIPALARRALLRWCQAAVAPSQFVAAGLGRSSKIRVVPNGIDLSAVADDAAAAAFRRELGIAGDAPLVGCVGRVRPWKGQGYFVEVAARLAERLPEARFAVVGATLFPDRGRDYLAELKAQAERLGVADRVLFTGHRDDPLAALCATDVVVNCSQNEPFGRVLIEAMACRRPVVAFRSGAVPEIVVDGSTGLLVPFGDTTGMAEAICDLVRNRTRAEAYGEAGRQRVAEHFTLQASTAGMEAVYGELAGDAA